MNTRYRTGQERFYDKYPEYPRIERSEEEFLGIGAMVILPILKTHESVRSEE